ncbi:MAG: hypothetical protein R3B70_03330 [Polyangiaceae bacterium]
MPPPSGAPLRSREAEAASEQRAKVAAAYQHAQAMARAHGPASVAFQEANAAYHRLAKTHGYH